MLTALEPVLVSVTVCDGVVIPSASVLNGTGSGAADSGPFVMASAPDPPDEGGDESRESDQCDAGTAHGWALRIRG